MTKLYVETVSPSFITLKFNEISLTDRNIIGSLDRPVELMELWYFPYNNTVEYRLYDYDDEILKHGKVCENSSLYKKAVKLCKSVR